MEPIGTFPFGQPVQKVVQTDCTPKSVFVLGVYASAVHARWVGPSKKEIVKALAVASEPTIFWRGEDAEPIINQIKIPEGLGQLLPAERKFNGPSGIALDELVLDPLGVERSEAWLCDLVPHSCVNVKQKEALRRAYDPVVKEFNLPIHSVPPLPKQLTDAGRRAEILAELKQSKARVLVLLGDLPIKWFLAYFVTIWKRLADFGRDHQTYGKFHACRIDGEDFQVMPLCHPRQSAKLGESSDAWHQLHQEWCVKSAKEARKRVKNL